MKKKLLIALLALLSIVCLAFGLSACGESDKGTYYLFENDDYIMSEYIELDGKNWSDAHGMGGTYEIKDGTISLYMDFFGQQTLWQTGTIGNGKLTLQGFSGEMTYFKEGMAHTHSFSEWHVTVEPTCTRADEKMRVCSCGESERLPVSALGHDTTGSSISITYATCSSVGKISGPCKRCGEQIDEEIPIKPNNHYIEDGKNTTVCSGCGIQLAESSEFQVEDNGEATLTEGEGASITIPAVYHGKPVTSIGSFAFDGCTSLESITIPNSVTSIGRYAFSGCTSLETITIGNGVTSIGEYAFYNCESLTSITIPDSVTSIEQSVFSGCTSLTSITIPDSVTSIGGSAFSGCTSLLQVNFGNNSKLESIGDWAFDGCTNVTSITIPNNVTSIEQCVFSGCTNLTSVTIGNGVTSIGSFAFDGCTNLTGVYITDLAAWCNIEFDVYYANPSYGVNPLYYAHNLYLNNNLVTEITADMLKGVTEIKDYAFYECTSLESIEVPASVTHIGKRAFYGCTSLMGVYITDMAAWCNIEFSGGAHDYYANPLCYADSLYLNNNLVTDITADMLQGATEIKDYAFSGYSSLESIEIPDSVTSIGSFAFRDCTNFKGVYITDIKAWCNIEFDDYYANPLEYAHNLYLNDNLVTNITADMLQGVIEINDYAFYNCTSLESIEIPDSVTSIGYEAFRQCTSLTSVTIGNSVTSIGNYAFYYCKNLASVKFENTAGWKVSKYSDMSNATNVTVTDDAAQNAELLAETYDNYYWRRYY